MLRDRAVQGQNRHSRTAEIAVTGIAVTASSAGAPPTGWTASGAGVTRNSQLARSSSGREKTVRAPATRRQQNDARPQHRRIHLLQKAGPGDG